MIQAMFLTEQDIVKAKKRLDTVHNIFKSCEQEAVIDFANCLKPRLCPCSAFEFLTICEKAADDLLNPEKVPEVYDQFTVGRMKDMANIFAESLFGSKFAREVQVFIERRKLV